MRTSLMRHGTEADDGQKQSVILRPSPRRGRAKGDSVPAIQPGSLQRSYACRSAVRPNCSKLADLTARCCAVCSTVVLVSPFVSYVHVVYVYMYKDVELSRPSCMFKTCYEEPRRMNSRSMLNTLKLGAPPPSHAQ